MLLIGLHTTKAPIRVMKDYALGIGPGYKYSLWALVGTLVATEFGAGSLLGDSNKIFKLGLGWLLVKLTIPVLYLIIGEFVAPRFKKILEANKSEEQPFLSVGDIMGHSYGQIAKVITGFCGLLMCIGVLGAQVSAIGWLLNYCFGWSYEVGILLGFGVTVAYTFNIRHFII